MLDEPHVKALLGARVETAVDLGRHHSWTLHRARLDDGREVFVKAADDDCGSVFLTEAAGLAWLADGDPAAPLPAVLAADEKTLILPWMAIRAPAPVAAERFGRELAGIHSRSPATYGAPWPGWIADQSLDNTESTEPWPTWYAECRLRPFLRRGAVYLEPDERRQVERVIDNIDDFAGPPEPPSRIHGDLWPGNVLWTDGRAIVVDPAAHGGHRETDLAMLGLFGGIPCRDRILAAYNEVSPLAEGWRDRIALHQLHNLLVHLALFGGSYRAAVIESVSRVLNGRS